MAVVVVVVMLLGCSKAAPVCCRVEAQCSRSGIFSSPPTPRLAVEGGCCNCEWPEADCDNDWG